MADSYPWTVLEQLLLAHAVERYGEAWAEISQRLVSTLKHLRNAPDRPEGFYSGAECSKQYRHLKVLYPMKQQRQTASTHKSRSVSHAQHVSRHLAAARLSELERHMAAAEQQMEALQENVKRMLASLQGTPDKTPPDPAGPRPNLPRPHLLAFFSSPNTAVPPTSPSPLRLSASTDRLPINLSDSFSKLTPLGKKRKREEATAESAEELEAKRRKTEAATFMTVINAIARHKFAFLFKEPVKEAEAPGYSSIIRCPMDLSTMRQHVSNGKIASAADLYRSVMLMFQNAFTFNPKGSVVYEMTVVVKKFTLKKLHTVLELDADLCAEDPSRS